MAAFLRFSKLLNQNVLELHPKFLLCKFSGNFEGLLAHQALYKSIIKPLLFSLDAESAHNMLLSNLNLVSKLGGLSLIKQLFPVRAMEKPSYAYGLKFKNSLGLAAGMDKNAEYIPVWEALGFGHIEIGTVTPKPQPGNPKPRLFRLPSDRALINRMGFNNKGVQYVKEGLSKINRKVILGANIGKNKTTPNDLAWQDYLTCFTELQPYVDYFTINVSSPNTPGLRDLQNPDRLEKIFSTLQEENVKYRDPKPLLLKLAPDLEKAAIAQIVELSLSCGISGLVLTNTTIDRNLQQTPQKKIDKIGPGGLSGSPLREKANELLEFVAKSLEYPYPIVGVGGICSAEDALEKKQKGASLLQIYSGLVYEGPALIQEIVSLLEKYPEVSSSINTF